MEKEVCLVEIISCDVPTAWYASLVGMRFECYEWGKDYVLKQDYDAGDQHWWRHITKGDCVVVNTAEQNAHLTPETQPQSQAVVNASALEQSDGDTSPAQAQVA